MSVNEKKIIAMQEKMLSLGIAEKDIIEKFLLGSGSGGQKVNKTHTCVYLQHKPSKIEVKCQKTRSREDNRYFARKELCSRYEEKILLKKSFKQKLLEKVKKQKKRRKRRSQSKDTDS